jgi:hypothetical protein
LALTGDENGLAAAIDALLKDYGIDGNTVNFDIVQEIVREKGSDGLATDINNDIAALLMPGVEITQNSGGGGTNIDFWNSPVAARSA